MVGSDEVSLNQYVKTIRYLNLQTATIAQKSSEVTTLLAQREDRLEEELRGLQRALLAMQVTIFHYLGSIKRIIKYDIDISTMVCLIIYIKT